MEYPDNSRRVTPQGERPNAEPKEVKKVVTGEVVRRKKPLGRRFTETFVGGDAKGVWGYVMIDVIIPAVKDTIADAFNTGIERMLFPGETRYSGRRGHRPGANGYVAYNRFSSSSSLRHDPRDEPRGISRRARANHNFDEIILDTRVEAEEVISSLFEIISKYEQVTVADLYDLVGISGTFQDNKWGWTDIRGAGVTRVRGGYLLDLPRPDPLD